ncbi:hypothetical protein GYMLUDRAFT_39896 [Collybiopsis luxurians FD-317 M1]|nr:hypothetical protein GYMLUDRAFT_39896 [Collybiopsis luxurians FD-317 M1]
MSSSVSFQPPIPSLDEPPVSLSRELADLIPIDIYEHIISFIFHPLTLKNCSQTCRAWLRPSWKNLFGHSIVRIHRKNVDNFLELVDRNTQFVTIIRFIQLLHIEQGGSNRLPISKSGLQESGDYEVFQFDDFLHQFTGLTSIRELKLGWVRNDTSALTSVALRNNFAGITVLDLDSMILSSSQHFFDILRAFPSLSSLSLTGVLFNGGRLYDGLDNWDELDARRTDLNTTPSPPPKLCELYTNVTEDVLEFLYSWVTHHRVVLPMRSISTGLFSQSSNTALSGFLSYSGSALEEIMIRDAHESGSLDLSPCVKLGAIEIGCIYLDTSNRIYADGGGSATFVTDVLQTVSSECVEFVKIVVAISDYEDVESQVEAFDWTGLAQVLKKPQFKNLKRFVISAPNLEHAGVIKRAIGRHRVVPDGPQLQTAFDVKAWTRARPNDRYPNLISG